VFVKDKIHLKKVILDESCLYKIQDSSKYFDSCAVTGCERSCLNLNKTYVLYRQNSFKFVFCIDKIQMNLVYTKHKFHLKFHLNLVFLDTEFQIFLNLVFSKDKIQMNLVYSKHKFHLKFLETCF
jgi:hypothetical protein